MFSKITKHQCLWKELSYFVYLFHVVTHPWKLQCYVVLDGPACPKFSEITNHQYLWKGLSDLVDFLHVVICILLEIYEASKICYFGLALSVIGSQPIRLSDVLNLKKLLCFCLHWSYTKSHAILSYDLKALLANHFVEIFIFDLFALLILMLGVHCYSMLVLLSK